MILTTEDRATYFPGLSADVTTAQLNLALIQGQMIAESPEGANRPLEKQSFTDILNLNSNGRVFLSRFPIATSPTLSLQIRGGEYGNFGINFTGVDWQDIDAETYRIDYDLGEITILNQTAFTIWNGVTSSLTGSPWVSAKRRPTKRFNRPQVRVVYTAGYDFSVDTADTLRIKSALAGLVNLRFSKFFSEGVKEFTLENFYSVSYGASTDVKSASEQYMQVFRQYRSRSLPI